MRVGIGSAVIVLIAVWIGFGYLLYGYNDTAKELNIVSKKAAQLEQENQALREQVDSANTEIKNLNVQVNELKQQVLIWQEKAHQFEGQNQALEAQNAALAEKEQSLEVQNATLDEQINSMRSSIVVDSGLPVKTTNTLGLPFWVPSLPIAIVATYVVAHQRTKNAFQKSQGTRLNNTERGNMVKLSDDEMKAVIKMRRGQ